MQKSGGNAQDFPSLRANFIHLVTKELEQFHFSILRLGPANLYGDLVLLLLSKR
jgi:hypothetical protein